MLTTAIVILNWNGKSYLQQFLPALIKNTKDKGAFIVVADNASTDDSVEFIKTGFPSIRLLILEQNYGFAKGYNKALARISADYYVLLNSDVEVTENWLTPLLEHLNTNANIVACQPKIISFANRTCFEHAGASGGYIDKYGFPFCRGRIFSNVEQDNGQYDTIANIFWATGACLMIRAKEYWNTGGLDDEFFAHMEEIDLCWRLRSRGKQIVCIPQSTVYHIGGGTLNAENPRKTYLNFRNSLLLLYKNLPQNILRKTLFIRFLFDYLAAFQLLISGKYANAKMVRKARKDYHKMKTDFAAKRLENLQNTTGQSIPEIYPKSIVIQYYLRGKKRFCDLLFKNPQK